MIVATEGRETGKGFQALYIPNIWLFYRCAGIPSDSRPDEESSDPEKAYLVCQILTAGFGVLDFVQLVGDNDSER